MNSTIKNGFLENFNFLFEKIVITVISFAKMAETFFHQKYIFQVMDSIS